MAGKQPTSPEEVYKQMIEAEEGKASSVNHAPLVPVNSTEPSESLTMQLKFQKEAKEYAKNRVSMSEAHEMREAELKKELLDNGLGFLEIPIESLPTGGIFYPEGTRLYVRSASGGDIRHWSMTDETDVNKIDDAITYIIQRCLRISYPNGRADWKDLKEIDRLYLILAIRDFTFTEGNNELKIKVTEDKEVVVHKDDISIIKIPEKMMRFYNADKRCFTFPVKNPKIGSIDIFMPSVGITQWLKNYIRKKQDRQEKFDEDFVTVAPLLIPDYHGLSDAKYAELLRSTMSWGPYEWSLLSKVKSIIQESVTAKMKYYDEGGAEAETPLNFQGGIKALFNIDLDEALGF